MQKLRPLLRHTSRSITSRFGSHPIRRSQHYRNGPHKEYFQTPSQTQELRQFGYRPEQIPNFTVNTGLSRTRRFLRGLALFNTFLLLGWVTGQGLITWEYLQPPFPKGSDEEKEFQEDIDDILDSSEIVQNLLEDGWSEVDFATLICYGRPSDLQHTKTDSSASQLIRDTLSGPQGVTSRFFIDNRGNAMLVSYFGHGIEGWPDVIHGGFITTMFEHAIRMTAAVNFNRWVPVECRDLKVNFARPVRPGQIYGVIVTPGFAALPEGHPQIDSLEEVEGHEWAWNAMVPDPGQPGDAFKWVGQAYLGEFTSVSIGDDMESQPQIEPLAETPKPVEPAPVAPSSALDILSAIVPSAAGSKSPTAEAKPMGTPVEHQVNAVASAIISFASKAYTNAQDAQKPDDELRQIWREECDSLLAQIEKDS